jgi:hypothetical protein
VFDSSFFVLLTVFSVLELFDLSLDDELDFPHHQLDELLEEPHHEEPDEDDSSFKEISYLQFSDTNVIDDLLGHPLNLLESSIEFTI